MRHINLWASIIILLFCTYIAWGALAPIRENFASNFGDRVDGTLGSDANETDSNIDSHYEAAFNIIPYFITGLLIFIGYMAMQSREQIYRGGPY